jgi:DNA-binding IclR family transcriptional regulator
MQTIDRAFAVLRALASRSETSTLADTSRAAGLPKSTTSRILTALEDLGMVDRVGGRYSIGSGLATLTHVATPVASLRDVSRPYLADLAERLGENASLAVADGKEVLYVDSVSNSGAITVQSWTGERVPFHGSAAGLALMTGWNVDRLGRYAATGLASLTPATVTSVTALRRRMKQVRTDGFAWTRAEFSDEVNGVAAPIPGPKSRAIGALSVYGPVFRFPGRDRPDSIGRIVVDAAERLGQHLGAA